jgi:hypothetical protein
MTISRGLADSAMLVVLFCALLGAPAAAQTGGAPQEDPNPGIFMRHLRANWDDIHDVIMRFHNDDPGLKGVVCITMVWREGALACASVDSNSTGNPAFGPALIAAMKPWRIQGLGDGWTMTVPIRTFIRGSDRPEFPERGIFTGSVADQAGNPVAGARLVLLPGALTDAKPDTCYANREGIFIQTLIMPGDWRLECSKAGYSPAVLDRLTFGMGQHVKQSMTLVKD